MRKRLQPVSSKVLCVCWNVRSINNKTDSIMNFVVDNEISLFFVTETWLTDMYNHTTATIKSYGYQIHHCFRSNTGGGGVAIIFKPLLKVVKIFVKHATTFESVSVKMKFQDNSSLFCSCVYRTGNLGNFIDDFDQYLGDVFLRYEKILICGDINIHLDKVSPQSTAFINTISSYGLYQLVSTSTHKAGHILDVVISSHKIVVGNSVTVDGNSSKSFPTCDHLPLIFELTSGVSPGDDRKKISFRNLKSVDTDMFRSDLTKAMVSVNDSPPSFSDCITHYNLSCANTLDKYAPEYSKMIRDLPTAPWFDSEYKNARRKRRKAEKVAKKSGLETDHDIFVHLRLQCNELAKQKKTSFFRSHFVKYNYSQKSLYQFVDMFLDQSSSATLPPSDSLQDIVDQFNDFFTSKIEKIRENFPQCNSPTNSIPADSYNGCSKLTDFEPTSIEEIREILRNQILRHQPMILYRLHY